MRKSCGDRIGDLRYKRGMAGVVPQFGDHVRIRATPLTARLGLAGLIGTVYGETTPSITGVEVIGDVIDDYAVNVMIERRKEALWFGPQLVEFVDHAAGSEVRIGSKCFVREQNGEWIQTQSDRPPLGRSFISWLFGGIFRARH
jgi:hypothetical protein